MAARQMPFCDERLARKIGLVRIVAEIDGEVHIGALIVISRQHGAIPLSVPVDVACDLAQHLGAGVRTPPKAGSELSPGKAAKSMAQAELSSSPERPRAVGQHIH